MNEITANLNWLAVIVGTVVSFLLGWLWYSPKLFGVKWAQGVGIQIAGESKPPLMAMLTQLVGTFLLAWVIGLMAVSNALLTTILIVLVIIFLVVSNGLFAQKNTYAVTVEAGFIAAMAVVMIVCQGIF